MGQETLGGDWVSGDLIGIGEENSRSVAIAAAE
jgi:hypothetical protein